MDLSMAVSSFLVQVEDPRACITRAATSARLITPKRVGRRDMNISLQTSVGSLVSVDNYMGISADLKP